MGKQRTAAQYRLIDLGLWLAIMLVFETVVLKAALSWFAAQAYYISVVPAVTAIVYMRWGAWGILHAVLGGLITGFNMGFGWEGILVYALGNALSIGAWGLLRLMGPENTRKDVLKTLLYALAVFLLMLLGKALAACLFDRSVYRTLITFAPEIVILLFTEVVIWIARRLDGVFEPQEAYLIRIQKQLKQERGENP